MKSITLLIDILIILAFFFSIFAIAGLNLWFGVLKFRWINVSTGAIHPDHDFWGSNKWPSGYIWAKTETNPNYGATSFDNIFYSFLIVIQSVTLEGWVYNMIAVEKASNYLSLLFFIPLIFVGAFFLLNLFLVVLKEKFTEEQTLIKEKNKNKIESIKSEEQLMKENKANIVYSSLKRISDNLKASKIDRVDSDDSHAQRRHLQNMTSLRQSQLDISKSKIFTPTSKLSTKFIENNNKSLSIKNWLYEESKEDIYLTNSNEVSRSDIWFTHCSDFGFDFSNEKYNKDNLPI